MPPAGYLSSDDIEECLVQINSWVPTFTELLPFGNSELGRPIRALRIGAGGSERNGALVIGGTHGRELINPDLLLALAFKLCYAYENDCGLTFGETWWSNVDVRSIVDGLDTFIVPNINPDGRELVLKPAHEGGDPWWRKNLGTNADGTTGADLARNCDFLWRWTIGGPLFTSSDPTSQQYKGDTVFSERESRNVREFINAHPHIACFADIHSYAEAIIYPWGDDENQSTDPSMSFQNPAWDGMRGRRGDTYKEYIPAADETKYKQRAGRMREAIRLVRHRQYRVLQVVELYMGVGVSGTPMDYAYSRFFTGPRRKVWAYTIETNRAGPDLLWGFQPPYAEAVEVMKEVQSGLIQFLLGCVCIVREIGKRRVKDEILDDLRVFRDDEMIKSRRGRRLVELLDTHSDELLTLFADDARARESAEEIVAQGAEIVTGRELDEPPTIDRQLAARIERLAARLEKKASPELRKALATVRKDSKGLAGKSARQAIR